MRHTDPVSFDPGIAIPDIGPLCPELYTSLSKNIPGGGEVLIAHPRMMMTGYVGQDNSSRGQKWYVTSWGETYRVNCPFCNDTRKRLWINHTYGQPDPVDRNKPGDFYGICFNENCMNESENRAKLWDYVFGLKNRNARNIPRIDMANGIRPDMRLSEKPLPGQVEKMINMDSNFAPMRYLHERRFNLQHIAHYDLHFCHHGGGQYPAASGRIIAPIHMYGKLVGWQGRYVGEPANKTTPKYYTCPGMPKSQVLYNYDNAAGKPFVVVFEGITDVWRFGDYSVAMLGSTLAAKQRFILSGTWTNNEPIIFCLDPDAYDDSALSLRELANTGKNPVVNVRLPDGWDPADLDRDPLWGVIREQAASVGVSLPDMR